MKKFNPPASFEQDYINLLNFIKQFGFQKQVEISPEEMEQEILEFQSYRDNLFKLRQSYLESKDRYNLSRSKAYENYRKNLALIRLKAQENPVVKSSLATFKRTYKRSKKNVNSISTRIENGNSPQI